MKTQRSLIASALFALLSFLGCVVVLALALFTRADAQTLPAELEISYTLPTHATDGSPLTGALALTRVDLYIAEEPIPPGGLNEPTASVPPDRSSVDIDYEAAPGTRVYVRVRACNAFGCGELTDEVSQVLEVPEPGRPSSVTVRFRLAPQ